MAKDYPLQSAQGKDVGRVYTLDAKKAKGNTNLVTSMCYVNKQPLFVLVDNGATHSFISTKCVQPLGFEIISLPNPMVITFYYI